MLSHEVAMPSKPTLISFELCPFVQRAVIVLEEQGRPYELKYIDLANKPDWFLKISPRGRVPVLEVEDAAIFESGVILEYLDETSPNVRLLAQDPLGRATQRMWMVFIGDIMAKGWSMQAAKDEARGRELVGELRDQFAVLLAAMPAAGPYWQGERYSMLDAAIASILQRFTWAERLEPSLGLFDDLPRLKAWRDAVLERPSTSASIVEGLERKNAEKLAELGSWLTR